MSESGAQPAVIAGIDASEHARDALALGRLLAELGGTGLIAASVYRDPDDPARRADAEAALAAVEAGDVETRAIAAPSPARGLHELADSIGATCIVLGSTHRAGLGRVLPGTTGERLLQEAPCAVAIAPRGYAERAGEQVRVVAVGYDLSPESEAAVDMAAELATAAEGTIRILTVDDQRSVRYSGFAAPIGVIEGARQQLRERVMARRDGLPAVLRADATVLSGSPAPELLEELDKGVDVMVLGSRGYGPIGRALAGSVSADVVRGAPCPVVLVARAAAAAR